MTAGGKGGQHEQKNQTAVRCIHRPSGAVAESREFKSQIQNKRSAFKKMAESKKFQLWARIQASKLMGQKSPEEVVDEMMDAKYLKVEYQTEKGWIDGK